MPEQYFYRTDALLMPSQRSNSSQGRENTQ